MSWSVAVWNAWLGTYSAIPKSEGVPCIRDRNVLEADNRSKRLYPVLVALQSILSVTFPESSWARLLIELLGEHPEVPLSAMGMFPGWCEDPFWFSAGRT